MLSDLAPVLIVGDESLGGIYLLRLRVARDTAVQFGRFRGGQTITVPAGDCLYIGSALRGLAARLLRHASRTDANQPQPIRAEMLDVFVKAGLTKKRPFSAKRLHWHIDYLLEQSEVELIQVFALRTAVGLAAPTQSSVEVAAAHELVQDPATGIIAPGLGARDDPGGTHLLGVQADTEWWRSLPQRLLLLDAAAKSAHNL